MTWLLSGSGQRVSLVSWYQLTVAVDCHLGRLNSYHLLRYHHFIKLNYSKACKNCRANILSEFDSVLMDILILPDIYDFGQADDFLLDLGFSVEFPEFVNGYVCIRILLFEENYTFIK